MSDSTALVHITTVPATLGFLTGQIGYMKAKGFQVHAISSPGKQADEFAKRERVVVHPIEMQRRIAPLLDLRALCRVRRKLQELQPLIVDSHTPKGGLLGTVGAWLARVPVRIYHLHGLPLATARGYKRLLLWCSERVSCLLAHQVLCVSHSLRKMVVENGICPAAKVKVLLNGSINGVDAAGLFNPHRVEPWARQATRAKCGILTEGLVVGFVGRIVHDKGIVELAEAWKVLREQFPQLHLLLVGRFEPQDPIPPEVKDELHGDPRIHMSGFSDDVAPLYAAMDVLAFPSYREGLGLVALEASAMTLPVVATCIPGCVDAVVDGVTGTLVPPRDAKALARALGMYLNHPELRHKHGKAGRERMLRDFRPEAMWEATYREYVRLLRQRGAMPEPVSEDSGTTFQGRGCE